MKSNRLPPGTITRNWARAWALPHITRALGLGAKAEEVKTEKNDRIRYGNGARYREYTERYGPTKAALLMAGDLTEDSFGSSPLFPAGRSARIRRELANREAKRRAAEVSLHCEGDWIDD